MEREDQYKIERIDSKLRTYQTIVKNYQDAIIDGINDRQLLLDCEKWVKELNLRINTLKKQKQKIINDNKGS